MKLIFMGTPDFSVPALRALITAGHEVVAVYSQPPRRAGRGKKERKGPVHMIAEEMGLRVYTPLNFKEAADITQFQTHGADMAIVVAYGLLLPKVILEAPRLGCTNIHASLLPRWRGAAPIHRAIFAGDAETGISIMQMEEGLDTGPVKFMCRTPVGDEETMAQLHDRLAQLGADAIVKTLQNWDSLLGQAQPQEGISYAHKIDKCEAAIDWTRPAEEVSRQIRALSPFPGAWCILGETRIKLLGAEIATGEGAPGTALDDNFTIACGSGALRITHAQRAGKAVQETLAFLCGLPICKGQRLGDTSCS